MPSVLCNPDRPLDRLWRRGKPFQPKCGVCRRWGMLLCLVFLGNVVGAYWYLTDPVRVRRMAEAYLSELTGGQVTVGTASLSLFEGLTLSHVTVKVIDADPSSPVILSTNTAVAPDAILLEADAFDVAYDPPSLLRGRLAAARIVAVGLHIHLVENVDAGRWNYQRLGGSSWPREQQHAPKVAKPPRRINLPQIVLRDAEVQYGELHGGQLTPHGTLALEGLLSPSVDNQQYGFELTSQGSPDGAGAVLSGNASLLNGLVDASLTNLQFGPETQAMLPSEVRQWWENHQLQGHLDIPQFHYLPARAGHRPEFHMETRLAHVKLAVPFQELASGEVADRFAARNALYAMLGGAGCDLSGMLTELAGITTPAPIIFQDVSGTYRFDEHGVTLDHVLGRIEGNLLACSGHIDGYSPDAAAHMRMESTPDEPIHIEKDLPFASSLPAQALQIYDLIRPYGTGSMWIEFDRPRPGVAPRVSGEIHVVNGGYVCKFYPYPVSHATGTVAFAHDDATDTDRVEFKHILGYGIGGGPNARSPVTLDGWVGPFDRRVGCGLHIVAQGITSEPAMFASLPPDVRTAVDSAWRNASPTSPTKPAPDGPLDLTMHGTIACDVNMPIGIGTKPSISTDLLLDDVDGALAAFPYPLHHLQGELQVHDTYFDLVNARMTSPGGGSIAAGGRVSWRLDEHNDVQDIRPDLHLAAKNLPIDDALRGALSVEQRHWLVQAGVSGLIDADGTVSAANAPALNAPALNASPAAPLDVSANLAFDLAVHLHNGAVTLPHRPAVLTDMDGAFRLTPDAMALQTLTARHGDAKLSASGTLHTPDNAPPVLDLSGSVDALALDDDLHALVPASARASWDELAPVGRVDAALEYHGPAARLIDSALPASGGSSSSAAATPDTLYALTLHPHGLTVQPTFFNYRLAATAGTVSLRPSGITVTDVVATHGPAKLQLAAQNTAEHPADWNVQLTAMAVPLDADLLRAAPPMVTDALRRSNARGSVSVRLSQLHYRDRSTPADPHAPGDIDAAGVLRTDELAMDVGAPVVDISGGVGFSLSTRRGTLDALRGRLAVDHLLLAQRPVDNLKADLEKPAGADTLKVSNLEGTVADGAVRRVGKPRLPRQRTGQLLPAGGDEKRRRRRGRRARRCRPRAAVGEPVAGRQVAQRRQPPRPGGRVRLRRVDVPDPAGAGAVGRHQSVAPHHQPLQRRHRPLQRRRQPRHLRADPDAQRGHGDERHRLPGLRLQGGALELQHRQSQPAQGAVRRRPLARRQPGTAPHPDPRHRAGPESVRRPAPHDEHDGGPGADGEWEGELRRVVSC